MDRPFVRFQALMLCDKILGGRKGVIPRELMRIIMAYCNMEMGMWLFDDTSTLRCYEFTLSTLNWTIRQPGHHIAPASYAMSRMHDGSMIVSGGYDTIGPFNSSTKCERISCYGGEFATSRLPDMKYPRRRHAAVLLKDGSLLVTGGKFRMNDPIRHFEILKPGATEWKVTSTKRKPILVDHCVVVLRSGHVLLMGGRDKHGVRSYCFLYDPADERFKTVARMGTRREMAAACLLPDGHVLITGGQRKAGKNQVERMRSCEIYSPLLNKWVYARTMEYARSKHKCILLGDMVYVSSVRNGCVRTERYDQRKNEWEIIPHKNSPAASHNAYLMPFF